MVPLSSAVSTDALWVAFLGRGELLLAALVLVWPVGALVTYLVMRPAREDAWQPFAGWMIAAVLIAVMLTLISMAMMMSNGTTRSMASLGPTIGAGLLFAGALVCGVVAGVLKLTGPRS